MKSRVIKIAALFTAVIMAACVFTACKKDKHTCDYGTEWKYDATQHWKECTDANCTEKSELANHDFGTGTTGAKPWLINYAACVCGQTKASETDYTKMTLAQFFDEMLNNEGNFIVDMTDNEGNEYAAHWEVNGKNSYFFETYFDNPDTITNYCYKSIVNDDLGVEYRSQYNENWNISFNQAFNVWLSEDGWIFKDELIVSADFNKDGNTYTLTSAKGSLDLSVITFNKTNIVMVHTRGTNISTYTITLGNSTKAIPQECQDLWNEHPAMMFGIAPDEFGEITGYIEWYFWCDNKGEGDAIIAQIIAKIVPEYEKGETVYNIDGDWGYLDNVGVKVAYDTNDDSYYIEFNDNTNIESGSYYFYLNKKA